MSAHVRAPLAKAGEPPRELVSSPSFLLKRLGFAVRDRVSESFEAAGASAYHYAVLAVLEEGDRETQATIADALAYDRSDLVGLLDELEERGLVERRRDPAPPPAPRQGHPGGQEALRGYEQSINASTTSSSRRSPRGARTLHALLLRLAAHHDPRYATNGQ